MSSFRRISSSTNKESSSDPSYRIPGVKSWIHNGLGLVSTGNKQLDELMGGGLALGTSLLIEVESYSNYGETLWIYSLAESISVQHDTLLVCSTEREAQRLLSLLPYNLTVGGVSEEEVVSPQEKKAELNIAWQYGKYINNVKEQKKSVISSSSLPNYCSSFDLSKRCQDSILSNGSLQTYCLSNNFNNNTNNSGNKISEGLEIILKEVTNFMKRVKETNTKQNVSRILIPLDDILSYLNDVEEIHSEKQKVEINRLVARFVLTIEQLIRGKHSVAIFSMHPEANSRQLANKIFQVCDTVVAVESFASKIHSVPYEFKEFQGFLLIGKIQQCGMLAPFRPSNSRYGLKRDRRKLHIEPLHLPPEESRAFGTAGTDANLVDKTATAAGGVQIHKPQQQSFASKKTENHSDHSHDQHGNCVTNEKTATSTVEDNSSGSGFKPNNKLAASLAAARAARQAAAAGNATSTPMVPVSMPGPVSISRGPNSKSNSAPLAQGSVCSTNLKSNQPGQPSYDF